MEEDSSKYITLDDDDDNDNNDGFEEVIMEELLEFEKEPHVNEKDVLADVNQEEVQEITNHANNDDQEEIQEITSYANVDQEEVQEIEEIKVLVVDPSNTQQIVTLDVQKDAELMDVKESKSPNPSLVNYLESSPEKSDLEKVPDTEDMKASKSDADNQTFLVRSQSTENNINCPSPSLIQETNDKESSLVILDDNSSLQLEDDEDEKSKSQLKSKLRKSGVLTIYPAPPVKGGISINNNDYECLANHEFLNDVIIDFYLLYLTHEILSLDDQKRTHIFSSHFYTRLANPPQSDNGYTNKAERRHAGVQRWTKNLNIFEKDFIVVPINEHSHWFLVIICFPYLVGHVGLESEALNYNYELRQPCIILFDSLYTDRRASVVNRLREYLQCEYYAKFKEEKDFTDLTFIRAKVPKQSNATDCGLYTLQYVEHFFKEPIKNYKTPFTNLEDWFEDDVIDCKREEIAKIIGKLAIEFNEDENIDLPNINFSKKRPVRSSKLNESENIDLPKNNDSKKRPVRARKYSSDEDYKPKVKPKKRKNIIDSDSSSDDATVPLFLKKSDKPSRSSKIISTPDKQYQTSFSEQIKKVSNQEKKVPCYKQNIEDENLPFSSKNGNLVELGSPPYYIPKNETRKKNPLNIVREASSFKCKEQSNSPDLSLKNISILKKNSKNSKLDANTRGRRLINLVLDSNEKAGHKKFGQFPSLPTFESNKSVHSNGARKSLENEFLVNRPPDQFYDFRIGDQR